MNEHSNEADSDSVQRAHAETRNDDDDGDDGDDTSGLTNASAAAAATHAHRSRLLHYFRSHDGEDIEQDGDDEDDDDDDDGDDEEEEEDQDQEDQQDEAADQQQQLEDDDFGVDADDEEEDRFVRMLLEQENRRDMFRWSSSDEESMSDYEVEIAGGIRMVIALRRPRGHSAPVPPTHAAAELASSSSSSALLATSSAAAEGDVGDATAADFTTILPLEILEFILSFLDPVDLHRAGQVSRFWHQIADADTLWKPACHRLWKGKFGMSLTSSDPPRCMAREEFAGLQELDICRFKKYYFATLADSKRTVISFDEVVDSQWDLRFRSHLHVAHNTNPRFFRNGTFRSNMHRESMVWRFVDNTHTIQVAHFPPLVPSRSTIDWSFKLKNPWVIIRTLDANSMASAKPQA
ncbi:hypothetical protein CAOG_03128 [Capsaspora owczarzaki ATCC 30864]|uniref:F-box domain-containing protein n=1 Tax=Capsaspora owczarzaki (strain ATCC 30864) TaxID=595528 RepID=A0A0D2UAS5_CAPO3|nr:hypothetical protein CAOG_03128 [Capsaspora owczarzaki ATCC 30864]KJE92106.1 hypothetical protein CAOG_003128 [Capsaspora owczarzaki ATCC 30864]|eukprot:XP_004363967.2 hypothetical protein CAOG_03128 [Capsaspora owczarzaki ATCC 30864]